MKEYDFIFSLGATCAVSECLRGLGLQNKASYPLDWAATPSLLAAAKMAANDFAGWFEREDLRLWDVTFTGGYIARCYKNLRTGFGFAHDFSNAEPFETHYAAVKEKYDRRTARFIREMSTARRILAVYIELSKAARIGNAEMSEALDLLRKRYPQAQIDLLYFYDDPAVTVPTEEPTFAEGITAVRIEYRTWHKGELMHVCDHRMLTDYLREHVTVPSPVPQEELRAFDRAKREAAMKALGKNWFERKLNHKLKKLYRDLEVYLRKQGIIPDEHPVWFD